MNPFRMGNYEIKKNQAAKEMLRPHSESPALQEMHMTLAGNTALEESEAERKGLGRSEERQGDSDRGLRNQVHS